MEHATGLVLDLMVMRILVMDFELLYCSCLQSYRIKFQLRHRQHSLTVRFLPGDFLKQHDITHNQIK